MTPLRLPSLHHPYPFLAALLAASLPAAQLSPGHRLISPLGGTDTYLVDNTGASIHTWTSSFTVGVAVYMKPDGNLLRTIRTVGGGGGFGGGLQELTLDGTLVWDFRYDSGGVLAHHDISPMPNGNVLMIAWEDFTPAQAIAAGRDPAITSDTFMPDHVIEVRPTGPTTGEIVWEWHVWDHLIQDFDPSLANFGDPAAHPELIDINYPVLDDGDFNHMNSVEYDPVHDWVILSARSQHEVWIIDHSTTTAEAAGHTGGAHGKGGDLLYRWGNPAAHGAGTPADQKLFGQHSAKRIHPGYPGAGHVTVFNNMAPGGSAVFELELPLDGSGSFVLGPGGTYGPAGPLWTYSDPGFQSDFMSSAERLPNGNTLICSSLQGRIFEIDTAGSILWELGIAPGFASAFHATYVARRLWSDEDTVSVATGGPVNMDLLAGSAHAGDWYILLGSTSGTSPGFDLLGHVVPLNPDAYFDFVLGHINGAIYTNSFGPLDALGNGRATVNVPAGLAPALVGTTVHHAMVTIAPGFADLTSVSNPVAFELAP